MIDPDQQILAAAHAEMNASVTSLFNVWAMLEDSLGLLMASIVNETSVGHAIYFAPTNFETRLKVVDAALSEFTAHKCPELAIADQWKKLHKSIGRHKAARNSIAHGHVSQISRGTDTRAFVRHVQSSTDPSSARDFALAFGQRQLPGLSSSDISQAAEAISKTERRVEHLSAVVRARWLGDEHTLHEKYRSLVESLTTDDPLPGDQILLTPGRPPRSFPG